MTPAPKPEAAQKPPKPVVPLSERLTWRLNDIEAALGVSRRSIERERSAGRFPRPDLTIGRAPLWKPATIAAWVEGRGNGR
jgi:predicted DNA-binding transcriptional regulator AlpA